MIMGSTLAFSAQVIFLYMFCLFLFAQVVKNNSIVDIGWGMGFILVSCFVYVRRPESDPRKLLMLLLVILWGLRLSIHVFLRNRGKGEDFRYARWRREWGRWFVLKSFLFVFMLQGAFMLVVSLPPVLVLSSDTAPLSVLDGIGITVFLIGFFFETVGDLQLSRFIANPENKGKLMTQGLWSWTRHPNYFGESTLWWGLFLISVSSKNGWIAILSPLTITFSLLFVSGVPLLEKKYEGRKDFEEYKNRTSLFFPFFHKRRSNGTP
jgi:steroid 5-alpha reductase family enzyme